MKSPDPSVLLSLDLLYATYQSTYFIDVLNHGVIKDPKITLIRYLHQKIFTKHDYMLEITCFHVMLHLNLK